MSDSRRAASRGWRMAAIRPLGARSTPMIGWRSRTTHRPRASTSAVTESTRNGQSSELVSSTEPSGS